MSRRDVLRMGALLGVLLLPVSCRTGGEDELIEVDAPPTAAHAAGRSVIVVGAGAAGLSAAHLLARSGVEVVILEAGTTHGGRMRHALDVVDFPSRSARNGSTTTRRCSVTSPANRSRSNSWATAPMTPSAPTTAS